MDLAVDSTSSALKAFSAASTNTLSWPHTCSGSDRFLVASAAWWNVEGARTVSSVTYNSVGLTAVPSSSITSTDQGKSVQLWSLIAPATGANNVVITLSGNDDLIVGGAVSFTGADQSSPLGTAVTAKADDTTPQLTLSSAADEIVVGSVSFVSLTAADFSTSDTEAWEQFDATTNGNAGAYSTGAATVTLDWSGDTGSFDFAGSGVPVKPVSVGGAENFEATGDLDAQAATIAGSATLKRTSTGALQAGSATIAGTASVKRTATGALQAGSATIAGTASLKRVATGDLEAQAATIDGDATVSGATNYEATGSLQAQAATISGAAVVGRAATGDLQAGSAQISGTVIVHRVAVGALVSQSAEITGSAENSGAPVVADVRPAGGWKRHPWLRRRDQDDEDEAEVQEEPQAQEVALEAPEAPRKAEKPLALDAEPIMRAAVEAARQEIALLNDERKAKRRRRAAMLLLMS